MTCTPEEAENHYTAPTKPYALWQDDKLISVENSIKTALSNSKNPTVIVLEVGHFKLPKEEENLTWAKQNISFAEALCKKIVKKYKHKIKIIPTMLVNNLDIVSQEKQVDDILDLLLCDNKYITKKSLKLLSERNLKNRAYKALKSNPSLSESFIHIDGKAYFKDKEYEHNLAAGFVSEDGDIVPRCGLILTSFMDKITDFSLQRMHQDKNIEIVFVSFSQELFEYKRVKLGVDIYTSTHHKAKITPIILHWSYPIDQCLISYRHSDSKKWSDLNA